MPINAGSPKSARHTVDERRRVLASRFSIAPSFGWNLPKAPGGALGRPKRSPTMP